MKCIHGSRHLVEAADVVRLQRRFTFLFSSSRGIVPSARCSDGSQLPPPSSASVAATRSTIIDFLLLSKYNHPAQRTVLQSHLQEVHSNRVLLQQEAVQRHPLADQLHYLLLRGENVGRLLLIGALWELCLVRAAMVKGHNGKKGKALCTENLR